MADKTKIQWTDTTVNPTKGGHAGNHQHLFAMEWADELRGQCAEFGVAYFLKKLGSCVTVNGEKVRGHRGHGGDWSRWPQRLRVRQMPAVHLFSIDVN